MVIYLPPPPGRPGEPRFERMVDIPYAAWPLVGIYWDLGEYLESLPPTASRPILGDATDDREMHRRLVRFLFAPLLAAEAAGQQVMPTGAWDNEKWLQTTKALGRLWEQAIPDLIAKARAWADKHGRTPIRRMGFNPDREQPEGWTE